VDTDLALVGGLVLVLLALPALVAAWSDRRRPVLASVLLLGGAALVGVALWLDPRGSAPRDIPAIVLGVLGRWL
jgi:hypothetical protein